MRERVLRNPERFVGQTEKQGEQYMWVYDNDTDELVHRKVEYVAALYKIFDEVLVNAADTTIERDTTGEMGRIEVDIDQKSNLISVCSTGDGGVSYGRLLANIFSTECTIEVAHAKHQLKYKQVFRNHMSFEGELETEKYNSSSESWIKISFQPDLEMFHMTKLEADVVALMKKRVFDLAACLPHCSAKKVVKVVLDGKEIQVKSFPDYVQLFLNSANKNKKDPPPRIDYMEGRWQISISVSSSGQFQQVSFVNNINTIKGGTHVDYITKPIVKCVIDAVKMRNRELNLKPCIVKDHLWVFVNAFIDNPVFDSQTSETLITPAKHFGTTCELSDEFLKLVVNTSGVVENLISWADTNMKKELDAPTLADLPSMVDGLKPTQRQVLSTALQKNLVDPINVVLFSCYASRNPSYHDGDASIRTLQSTIIGMAQDFVGANNINLFTPIGHFGTRVMGGKDAASPRYLSTNLTEITRFIFPEEDDVLLNSQKRYMPIIPMVLVNGSERIEMGWRRFSPSYNPKDIIANLRRLLEGNPVVPMDPWYRKFRGTIIKQNADAGTYDVFGTMEVIDEASLDSIDDIEDVTLKITELPPVKTCSDYREFLHSLTIPSNDIYIRGYSNYSTDDTVDIVVVLSKRNYNLAKKEDLYEKFKLRATLSTRDIAVVDEEDKKIIYETPEKILEKFYDTRLACYKNRKKKALDIYSKECEKVKSQIKFIEHRHSLLGLDREDLLNYLKDKKFYEEETCGKSHGYDYLLSMRERLTIPDLERNLYEVQIKRRKIAETNEKDLWYKDLDALENALNEEYDGIHKPREGFAAHKLDVFSPENFAEMETDAPKAVEDISDVVDYGNFELKTSGAVNKWVRPYKGRGRSKKRRKLGGDSSSATSESLTPTSSKG